MASISPTTLNNGKEPYTGKNAYLRLTITEITQTDGNTNQTTVSWKITTEGTPWTTLYRAYCTLGGKVLYDAKPELTDWRAGTVVKSGTTTFDNNSDGTLTLRAYIKQMFYYGNGDPNRWTNSYYYQENSVDMVCSQIARYFSSTPTFELTSKTETSATFSWTTSENASVSQYKIDNGAWVDVETNINKKSGTITITGLTPGQSYTIYGDFKRYDSGLWAQTKPSVNVTTYDYPYVKNCQNFIIGDKISYYIYNPLNRQWVINIKGNDGSQICTTYGRTRHGDDSVGSSAEEITAQYSSIPNSKEGTYTVQLICNELGRTTTHTGAKYYIKDNDTENPTFSNSNVIDVVDTLHVDDITGLASKIIKGHNSVTGKITKMIPNYSSKGSRYIVKANANPSSQELSYSDGATKSFAFQNITANSFTVIAYDSRGLPATASKTIDLVDYSKPKVNNFTITRQNGLGEYAILAADGTNTYWKGWSQIKKYNTIQNVFFRYRAIGGSYSNWIDITEALTKNNNGSWIVNATLDIAFDVTTKYDFELYVVDLLETSSNASNVLSTANGFLWRDLKNKRFGINKKPEHTLDVNGETNMTALYIDGKKMIWYE